jgi:hypothetical protein
MAQLEEQQEQAEHKCETLYDHYASQAFAVIRAAGFDPRRGTIAGMYTAAAPLVDLVGGDRLDPGEVLVILAYRPPADDAPLQQSDPSAQAAAEDTDIPLGTGSWFHEHARILLVTLAEDAQDGGDGGTVWILGG